MEKDEIPSHIRQAVHYAVALVATVAVIANLGFAPWMLHAVASPVLSLFVAATATSYYVFSVTTALHRARAATKPGTLLLSAVPVRTFLAETAAFLILVVPVKGTVLPLYLGAILVRAVT